MKAIRYVLNGNYSQGDFGNNCAHSAKSVKLSRIVVQYLSFDFFADHISEGSIFRNIVIIYVPDQNNGKSSKKWSSRENKD